MPATPRAQRAPGEWLDRLDQRIAGLDVDAGVAVGKSFDMLESKFYSTCRHSLRLSSGLDHDRGGGIPLWLLSPISRLSLRRDPRSSSIRSSSGSRATACRALCRLLVLLLAVAVAVAMMLVVLPCSTRNAAAVEKLRVVAWFNAHAAPWLKAGSTSRSTRRRERNAAWQADSFGQRAAAKHCSRR